jgi:hypothetical protein
VTALLPVAIGIVVGYVLAAGVAGLYLLRALHDDPEAVEEPKYAVFAEPEEEAGLDGIRPAGRAGPGGEG